MKTLLFVTSLTLLFVQVMTGEVKQKSKKEIKAEEKARQVAAIKQMIENKNFVFDATSANPMNGSTVNLTTNYNLKIKNDSVFSYLPYYGVAYSAATFGSGDSPMIFSKPLESYTAIKNRRGYLVKFKAKNSNDVIDGTLQISETGSSSLSISSMNRQSISYFGNLVNEKDVN